MQCFRTKFFVAYIIQCLLWRYAETAAPVINNLPASENLLEDTSTEILLFTLDATDADGDTVTCSFGTGSNPGTGTSRFIVRYVTGTTDWGIYTKADAGYDFNSQPTYSLVIDCEANGDTDTETFTVNLLENQRPVINNLPDSRTLVVSAVSIGDIVFTVNVTDAENDVTTLSITCDPASPACPFEIFNSGALVLTEDISNIAVGGYDVTVDVSDDGGSGTPEILSITFSGANNQPVIQNLGVSLNIPENSALGNTLETTTCTDSDAGDTLAYSMSCTPSMGLTYFQIDSATGVISTSASSSINYEYLVAAGVPSFTCTVTCSDGEVSDTATVDFDVTNVNEAPRFAQNGYSISVDEGVGGTAIQTSAYDIIDEDAGDTEQYTFDCGTSTGFFSIDTDTGLLSFGTDFDVDSGVQPTSVDCDVTVTDSGGLTDTTTLSIEINNINDNSPVFLQNTYSWFISEGASVGTSVGTVSATDADIGTFGDINYSLDQSSLATDYFGIDQTGKVYLHNSIAAVGGGVTLTFDVLATDGGGNVTTETITVITVTTTTTTTTTTTDRFKTFFEDTRNIAWFTACWIVIAITVIVTFYMCYAYTGRGVRNYQPGKKRFNFKCCRCWPESKPRVKIEEPNEPIEEPPVVAVDKPKAEPEGFNFWSAGNEWNMS